MNSKEKSGHKGKKTAARIIEAAYTILQTASYKDFTLRNIAQHAGVRLSNVQYYYKTMDELLHKLREYLNERYLQKYSEILADLEGQPEQAFIRYLEFHFADIAQPETRHLFLQLWPLLASADNYSGKRLNEFYSVHLDYITDMLERLCPDISTDEAHARAVLIASLFEGLMITAPRGYDPLTDTKAFKNKVIESALAIARGNH